MRRRLFTALSILSLVFFIAMAVLVVGGCFVPYPPHWSYNANHVVIVDGGQLVILRLSSPTTRTADVERTLPLWVLLPVTAIMPILLWRRLRKRIPGTCTRCGYNLTGNTSGICPECGTTVREIDFS
jgi:hypothetical protein